MSRNTLSECTLQRIGFDQAAKLNNAMTFRHQDSDDHGFQDGQRPADAFQVVIRLPKFRDWLTLTRFLCRQIAKGFLSVSSINYETLFSLLSSLGFQEIYFKQV